MNAGIKGAAIAGAVVTMMMSGSAFAKGKAASGKTMCAGVNACKGKGACKGDNGCKGKNDCKGKGVAEMDTKKDCETVGGTVAEAPKGGDKAAAPAAAPAGDAK
jgi:hypothetical protein